MAENMEEATPAPVAAPAPAVVAPAKKVERVLGPGAKGDIDE